MTALNDFAQWIADTLTSANADGQSSDIIVDVYDGKIIYFSPEVGQLYLITVQEAEAIAKSGGDPE